MSTWQEFYNQVKDPSWPNCDEESAFESLPDHVKQECILRFGYRPGQFRKHSKLVNRRFPINTDTACQLKWNWSTIFLTQESTASCHRTDHHKFDTTTFDFHNTPNKIQDRGRMLAGQWPERGCQYCRNIEQAGGQSDRMTNLDFPGMHAPPELDENPQAVRVTPRILEVYFDNTCNLKCLYCGPQFSSLWDAENIRFGLKPFDKSSNIEQNKQKIFNWLRNNGHNLTVFNILGGEPLYQAELGQCLDLFDQHPAPELKLQIFTNLNCKLDHLSYTVEKIKRLIDQNKLREFEVTASLDCWGAPQEYVRYPLDLEIWQRNFEYLLTHSWINLIISSTVTPLTIKTLPDLLKRIQVWNQQHQVHHYQNSVGGEPRFLYIDTFGDIFAGDFQQALALKSRSTPEQQASYDYLAGIARQSASCDPDPKKIGQLFDFLNQMDQRRGTNWSHTFPWLVDEFAKYALTRN
jgi:MoaA/NifB/PqqE/SkfB family radical SAM enzyme